MRTRSRSRHSGLLVTLVLAGTCGLGYGVGHAADAFGTDSSAQSSTEDAAAARRTPSTSPTPTPSAAPTPTPTATASPTAPATPDPGRVRVLGPGDRGESVREVQARLKQIAWYDGDVTGSYAASTTTAVRGFQEKRRIAASGVVDRQTLRRLEAMTHEPTRGERYNVVGWSASAAGPLDARCRTGRVICIDKDRRTLRWVVDGRIRAAMAVRFGSSYTPTREGTFAVQRKSRDHVSTLYDSAMPYSMFFSGGQAVHYSSDFAARGYAGASHGCVNVRDRAGIAWLYDQVRVGDRVVIAG